MGQFDTIFEDAKIRAMRSKPTRFGKTDFLGSLMAKKSQKQCSFLYKPECLRNHEVCDFKLISDTYARKALVFSNIDVMMLGASLRETIMRMLPKNFCANSPRVLECVYRRGECLAAGDVARVQRQTCHEEYIRRPWHGKAHRA